MAVGYPSLLRFWGGSAPPYSAPATVGFASLLAFWTRGGAGTSAEQLGGSLIRSRRRRWIYDEDSELGRLATLLGQHPPERTQAGLLDAVRRGLSELFWSGADVPLERADGALILTVVDQQIRLTGALRRHVETLIDDQEVIDLLELIV